MQADHPSKPLRSLDWLNFWIADVQTGVGPFLAAVFTARGWNPGQVGTFLTLGGLMSLSLQAPAGAAVDATPRKRTLIAASIFTLLAASLMFAFGSRSPVLFSAQLMLGIGAAFIGPSITGLTLGLVDRSAFDARLGRNQSFNAAGNFVSALLMGWVAWHWGVQAIFLTVPLLAVPALLSLAAIPFHQIDQTRARGADNDGKASPGGLRLLLRDRVLLAFAAAAFLFHLANAAMLPQLGELLAHGRSRVAAPFMSAAVAITQVVVAITAAGIGKWCARRGPRPILLLSFAILPVRGLLYTLTSAVPCLLAVQVLDGLANAIFGVASAVYIARRTHGSGHFNLAMGGFGTAVGLGAALSNTVAGFVAQNAGFAQSFLVLSAIATAAFLCLWLLVPDPESAGTSAPTSLLTAAAGL